MSLALAPVALEAGARVVDLSGAFRLTADEYPRWYGFAHYRPELLAEACYSMPEAATSGDMRQARLVSNPGCYATVNTLAALALLRAGVIEREGIIIDAKSGTTGAGRKASEDFSFSEIEGDFRAYRVLKHQHTPEIERALGLAGQPGIKVTFTPHLLPTRRGILATVYGRLLPGKTGADAAAAIKSFVAERPFSGGGHARRGPPGRGGRDQPGADGRRRRSGARRRDRVRGPRQPGQGGRRAGGAERQLDAGACPRRRASTT